MIPDIYQEIVRIRAEGEEVALVTIVEAVSILAEVIKVRGSPPADNR